MGFLLHNIIFATKYRKSSALERSSDLFQKFWNTFNVLKRSTLSSNLVIR